MVVLATHDVCFEWVVYMQRNVLEIGSSNVGNANKAGEQGAWCSVNCGCVLQTAGAECDRSRLWKKFQNGGGWEVIVQKVLVGLFVTEGAGGFPQCSHLFESECEAAKQ